MTDVLLRLCKARDTVHQGFGQLLFTGVWGGVGHESGQYLLGKCERDWEYLPAASTGLTICTACFKGGFADHLPGIQCHRCRTWCVF